MARSFGGTNSDTAAASIANPGGTALTIAGWIFWQSGSGSVFQTLGAFNANFGIWIHNVPPAFASYYVQTNVSTYSIDPGASVSSGAWNHLSLTADIGATAFKGFFNGVQDGATKVIAGGSFVLSTVFEMGSQPSLGGGYLHGRLADTGVWSAALTPLEIAALARGLRPPQVRPQSLLHYYPFYGISSPEPDLLGGANAVMVGTALAFGPPSTILTPRRRGFNLAPAVQPLMAQACL